jgi:hypothetical protein
MLSVLKDPYPFIDENGKNPVSCRPKMSFEIKV